MTRLFWRLVHLLPWRYTRRVCDLCDEFPFDPKGPWPGSTNTTRPPR